MPPDVITTRLSPLVSVLGATADTESLLLRRTAGTFVSVTLFVSLLSTVLVFITVSPVEDDGSYT